MAERSSRNFYVWTGKVALVSDFLTEIIEFVQSEGERVEALPNVANLYRFHKWQLFPL